MALDKEYEIHKSETHLSADNHCRVDTRAQLDLHLAANYVPASDVPASDVSASDVSASEVELTLEYKTGYVQNLDEQKSDIELEQLWEETVLKCGNDGLNKTENCCDLNRTDNSMESGVYELCLSQHLLHESDSSEHNENMHTASVVILGTVEHESSHSVKDVEHESSLSVKDVEHESSLSVKDVEYESSHSVKDMEQEPSHSVNDVEHESSLSVKDVEHEPSLSVKDVEHESSLSVNDVEQDSSHSVKDVENVPSHSVKADQVTSSNVRNRKTEMNIKHSTDGVTACSVQDEQERVNTKSILRLLRSGSADRESLQQLAISRGGLLNNELRLLAWPVLLDVDVTEIPQKPDEATLHGHRDYEQVVLDVNRSLKRFPPGMDEVERMSMQDQLVDCIMRVLCARPELHYYQGYHDIVVTFLLVVGEDVTFALMNELSMRHLRDFMYETMDKTTGMLYYLYPLLGRTNPTLRAFMDKAEVGTIFSLPWLITWYGHVLGDIRHIVRLYDFFIACHPLMPIYLAAAIVLYRGDEILQGEPEMPVIHCLLSRIPPDLPIEHLLQHAGDLFLLHPPRSVEREAGEQHQRYLEENEKKRKQLKQLARSRARTSWPLIGQRNPSVLVRVTVWTGAALLSAAAFTFISNVYLKTNNDSMIDLHWLWGS